MIKIAGEGHGLGIEWQSVVVMAAGTVVVITGLLKKNKRGAVVGFWLVVWVCRLGGKGWVIAEAAMVRMKVARLGEMVDCRL